MKNIFRLSLFVLLVAVPSLCAIGCGGDDDDSSADTDTDADSDGDMCSDYPAADNSFAVGSVARNFSFFDVDDVAHPLCSYADGVRKLALLVISGGYLCSYCADAGPALQAVAENHPDDVAVLDVIENGMDSSQTAKQILETSLGQEPWASATHPVLYVDPGTQMSSDWGASFGGYPTVPLIDLDTMQVLVDDCWAYPTAGAQDYEGCVSSHL